MVREYTPQTQSDSPQEHRLTRGEFERRYAADPHIKKAELISEFSLSELIVYYWQRLFLIHDPHLRSNPSIKDFAEVRCCPQKWKAFDIAVELHRNGSRPWVG